MTEVNERVRIEVRVGHVEHCRVYSFPDGLDEARVHELLNKNRFERIQANVTRRKVRVRIERVEMRKNGDIDWIAPTGDCYHLPDGWDVEAVHDLLRDNGFRRIDNTQPEMDELLSCARAEDV